MAQITLSFGLASSSSFELVDVLFSRSVDGLPVHSIRGKTSNQLTNQGSFQWTRAVQALALLLVKAKLYGAENSLASLKGEGGTLASSLDYALSKEPAWLVEMFGSDAGGSCYARRLIQRVNPERKRAGPVVLSVNPHLINENAISLSVSPSGSVNREQLVALMHYLESLNQEANAAWAKSIPASISDSDPFLERALAATLTAGGNTMPSFQREENQFSLSFNSRGEGQPYLQALLNSCAVEAGKTKGMVWHLKHAWGPIITPIYWSRLGCLLKANQVALSYVCSSDHITEKYSAALYATSGVRSHLGMPSFRPHDSWAFGDYIVEQVFEKELDDEIDAYYSKVQNIANFNGLVFVRNFLEAKSSFTLQIRKSKEARTLYSTVSSIVSGTYPALSEEDWMKHHCPDLSSVG